MIGIWNSVSTNKECGIEYLESGIHRMKSRIQDCLGLPCMRQLTCYDNWHLYHFPLTGSVCSLGLYITLKNVIFSPQKRSTPFSGLYEDTVTVSSYRLPLAPQNQTLPNLTHDSHPNYKKHPPSFNGEEGEMKWKCWWPGRIPLISIGVLLFYPLPSSTQCSNKAATNFSDIAYLVPWKEQHNRSLIDLVTVFDAILTSRQMSEKLQWLSENLMLNNFRRTAVLKKMWFVN